MHPSIKDHLHPVRKAKNFADKKEVPGLLHTPGSHYFIKGLESWTVWNHIKTGERVSTYNNIFPMEVRSGYQGRL